MRLSLAVGSAAVLTGCGSGSGSGRALGTARDQLASLHAADLGTVLGQGSYGSTGISGSRPTAFVAVRTEVPTDALMAALDTRARQAGFVPLGACRPPQPCAWERRAGATLSTVRTVVKTEGEPWGETSTTHGTVAAGSRVLQVEVVLGG